MKKIKILAAMHGKRYNDVIEEAVRDIIKKYRNKAKAKPSDDKKHKKKEKQLLKIGHPDKPYVNVISKGLRSDLYAHFL